MNPVRFVVLCGPKKNNAKFWVAQVQEHFFCGNVKIEVFSVFFRKSYNILFIEEYSYPSKIVTKLEIFAVQNFGKFEG